MSETPRTDAACHGFVQANPLKTDVDMWGIQCVDADFCRQLERELNEANENAKLWYEAGSPYATPTALREALALAQEEIVELRSYLTGSNGAFLALRKDAARYRWLRKEGKAQEEALLFTVEDMDRFIDANLSPPTALPQ